LFPSLCLAACATGGEASYPKARYKGQTAPQYEESASIFGEGLTIDKGGSPQSAPGVTVGDANPVWRAALEAISFMPLASANSTSGVIITDWYSTPGAPNEREKVNAYVLGREPRPESLRITVFRQERGSDGAWVDVSGDKAASDFKNAILKRAQQFSALEDTGPRSAYSAA